MNQLSTQSVAESCLENTSPWYALYLFNTRQKPVVAYFDKLGIETFYPQQYVVFEKEGVKHRELRPVVGNLLFVHTTTDNPALLKAIEEMPFNCFVYRKTNDKKAFYDIPHREMVDFIRMCNPEIELRKYITEEEARMKAGTEVYVKYGPLKGLTGRLIRSSKKYYLLKELPGIGIQLKVARWCCVPLES